MALAVTRSLSLACAALLALSLPKPALSQQQLGHKVPGGVGMNAGVQPEPGLYLLDRFMYYGADEIKDRNGNSLPVIGLDIDARGNMIGLAYTFKPKKAPFITVAAGAPLARVTVNSVLPLTAVDRKGLGDAFVQPIKLGWRREHYDVVAAYAFYAPTGKFEPRGGSGVGRGYWTHQFSIGGALFPKEDRSRRASILASYDINRRKKGIDIKRGNMVQLQGGAGFAISRTFLVGLAGFALWQVTDDEGADVPVELRGLRTRDFGIGPELGVAIVPRKLTAELRYLPEFGARSRPEGSALFLGLSYRAWQPAVPKAAENGR